jgi:hypothetical protein
LMAITIDSAVAKDLVKNVGDATKANLARTVTLRS